MKNIFNFKYFDFNIMFDICGDTEKRGLALLPNKTSNVYFFKNTLKIWII